MTQPTTRQPEPFYGQIWRNIKRFPQFLHQGNANPPQLSGEAAAAFLSASIGAIAMMIAHHLADADQSKVIQKKLLILGSWIPGADNPDPLWGNIGNYTGKETVLLLAWLISWIILYVLLKDRQVKTVTLFVWMIGLMTLATAMCWHPLFPYLPLV
ncbi:MAG: hypothetical protein AB4058_15175 [Microcystaceae cyanobacterium]